MQNKNPLKCLEVKKKIKQRHTISTCSNILFNINIYTEFNLKDVILAIP